MQQNKILSNVCLTTVIRLRSVCIILNFSLKIGVIDNIYHSKRKKNICDVLWILLVSCGVESMESVNGALCFVENQDHVVFDKLLSCAESRAMKKCNRLITIISANTNFGARIERKHFTYFSNNKNAYGFQFYSSELKSCNCVECHAVFTHPRVAIELYLKHPIQRSLYTS